MSENKNMLIPLEAFTGLVGDVRSAISVASYHLKYQVEKCEPSEWSKTQVPVLCDYYSCLNALKTMLESTIFDEDNLLSVVERILTEGEENGIIITESELVVVNTLTQQAQVLKDILRSSGLSMEIH